MRFVFKRSAMIILLETTISHATKDSYWDQHNLAEFFDGPIEVLASNNQRGFIWNSWLENPPLPDVPSGYDVSHSESSNIQQLGHLDHRAPHFNSRLIPTNDMDLAAIHPQASRKTPSFIEGLAEQAYNQRIPLQASSNVNYQAPSESSSSNHPEIYQKESKQYSSHSSTPPPLSYTNCELDGLFGNFLHHSNPYLSDPGLYSPMELSKDATSDSNIPQAYKITKSLSLPLSHHQLNSIESFSETNEILNYFQDCFHLPSNNNLAHSLSHFNDNPENLDVRQNESSESSFIQPSSSLPNSFEKFYTHELDFVPKQNQDHAKEYFHNEFSHQQEFQTPDLTSKMPNQKKLKRKKTLSLSDVYERRSGKLMKIKIPALSVSNSATNSHHSVDKISDSKQIHQWPSLGLDSETLTLKNPKSKWEKSVNSILQGVLSQLDGRLRIDEDQVKPFCKWAHQQALLSEDKAYATTTIKSDFLYKKLMKVNVDIWFKYLEEKTGINFKTQQDQIENTQLYRDLFPAFLFYVHLINDVVPRSGVKSKEEDYASELNSASSLFIRFTNSNESKSIIPGKDMDSWLKRKSNVYKKSRSKAEEARTIIWIYLELWMYASREQFYNKLIDGRNILNTNFKGTINQAFTHSIENIMLKLDKEISQKSRKRKNAT